MFANAVSATTSTDNDTTLQPDQATTAAPGVGDVPATTPASPVVASVRRNLFGIRLNHDQLKQDLNDMWKDQIDRQNQSWGFDFQKLKPLDNKDSKSSERFEWTKVQTRLNPFYNETGKLNQSNKNKSLDLLKLTFLFLLNKDVKSAVFDKEELTEEEYETEEEEYDDALAVPTFYKYQRRAKLNAEHNNRLKFIQLAAKSSTATTIKKPAVKKTPASTGQKTRRKQTRTVTPKVQKSLIITFSENRKDTLRSSASKSLAGMFEASSNSVQARIQTATTTITTTTTTSDNASSAFRQPMKQQSLLDMLKQRKRKVTGESTGTAAKLGVDEASVVHNLRTRTVSIN